MRITGGEHKGKRLRGPNGSSIRPTPQMVREAIFNILSSRVQGASVLDLFAGTGALGIEALSRGASHCVFVDISERSLRLIKSSLEGCDLISKAHLLKWDLRKGIPHSLKGKRFSIIFLDPPYDSNLAMSVLKNPDFPLLLYEDSKIVVETRKGSVLPENLNRVVLERCKTYGDTQISILGVSFTDLAERLDSEGDWR